MPHAVIRSAQPGDLEGILDLWRTAGSPWASTRGQSAGLRALIDGGEAVVVAEHEGEVVGSLIAAFDGWRGNMYRLAVADEHRRRGLASELVREGERRLQARGARRITALVPRDDAPSTGLWRAAGYAHDAVWARYVKDL